MNCLRIGRSATAAPMGNIERTGRRALIRCRNKSPTTRSGLSMNTRTRETGPGSTRAPSRPPTTASRAFTGTYIEAGRATNLGIDLRTRARPRYTGATTPRPKQGRAGRRPTAPRQACVKINQCVGCTRQFFTKSSGDDAAVLVPSSGEEPASPRHRAGGASMAWRTTRRFSTNVP